MFRTLKSAAVVMALAIPLHAWAACGVDTIPLDVIQGVPFVTVTPSRPDARQPTRFDVAVAGFFPDHLTASVSGGTIRLTFYGQNFGGVPPGLSCVNATLGPLSAGHYPVELFVSDMGTPATSILTATGAIDVTATPTDAAFAVPTLAWWSTIALVAGLGLGGVLARRRRTTA